MRLQLAALVVTAVTLPVRAQADTGTHVTLDTLIYSDDDRVIVVAPQAGVRQDLDQDGSEVAARASVDVVSAASVDVVSQATRGFTEERYEADLSGAKRVAGVLGSLAYRYSGEPDYVSHGGTIGAERRLGSADTVLAVTYGYTFDRIGLHGTSFSEWSRTLSTHSVEASLTQVLNLCSVLRVIATFVGQSGYMAKPYRHVPLFTEDTVDALGDSLTLDNFDDYRLDDMPLEHVPSRRWRPAVAALYIHHLGWRDAVFRGSYRFYRDSWKMTAHTAEAALDGQLAAEWRLSARARTHLQDSVYFWERAYAVPDASAIPRWLTLDRELSASISQTLGVGGRWQHGPFEAYADLDAAYTRFLDSLLLDSRLALVLQVGFRWTP